MPTFGGNFGGAPGGGAFGFAGPMGAVGPQPDISTTETLARSGLAPKPTLRTEFPETWIWTSQEIRLVNERKSKTLRFVAMNVSKSFSFAFTLLAD